MSRLLFCRRLFHSCAVLHGKRSPVTSADFEKTKALFDSVGILKSEVLARSPTVGPRLETLILAARQASDDIDKPVADLLHKVAVELKSESRAKVVAKYIALKKIKGNDQIKAAVEFCKASLTDNLDAAAFEEACGVGVVVTRDEIKAEVAKAIAAKKETLLHLRYRFPALTLIPSIVEVLKWADRKIVREEIETQVATLLGPATGEDKRAKKLSKTDPVPAAKLSAAPRKADEPTLGRSFMDIMGKALTFHKPGENYKTDAYVVTPNTERLLKEHLAATGGKVYTRFPPEPNGVLHIGHAKAINFNFSFAKAHGGLCYLRYDDTNPDKEEERFFTAILDMVRWLGYEPWKVTHASDYFEELYQLAVHLIKKGGAFVCHQPTEALRQRNSTSTSPWRDRPIEESLQLFEDMRNRKVAAGKATLRMKHVMEDGKVDPVAYRIKFVPHHRTGDTWCIYPTYDYTHCLCDSLENISHSLCTKEFQKNRSSYYWLCNAVDVYCPVQWEYSRMNVSYTVVSKRKIAKLIQHKIVSDWDDPRLFTLTALRRRGFPPEAINVFCGQVGVTMSEGVVHPDMLEAHVRDHLDASATRVMCVLSPLKLTITNFPGSERMVAMPKHPSKPEAGSHEVPFGSVIYIDRDDFREEAESGYRRLAPGQSIGLRHAGNVFSMDDVVRDSSGRVVEVLGRIIPVKEAAKPKAFIQWVSKPLECEVRMYSRLFKHENPEDSSVVPGGFLDDINPDSVQVIGAYVDQSVRGAKPLDSFQFERVGFFCVDFDTTAEKMVFNLTVTLKQDSGKN